MIKHWYALAKRFGLINLWLPFRWILLVPAMYVLALYCCLVEFLIDRYSAQPELIVEARWNDATLLNEAPQKKHIAILTGADGTIGEAVRNFCQIT